MLRSMIEAGVKPTLLMLVIAAAIGVGSAVLAHTGGHAPINSINPTNALEYTMQARQYGESEVEQAARAALASATYRPADMSRYFDMHPYDMAVWFEVRGNPEPGKVNNDGKYIAAGRLQFNAAPGYPLDRLLSTAAVREKFGARIDAFGGIRAIQRRDAGAIAGLKALLSDPEFESLYFAFAGAMYGTMRSAAAEQYGIDLDGRHPVIGALFRTIANNRYNDTVKVARRMCQEALGRRLGMKAANITDETIRLYGKYAGFDEMTDAEFLDLAERALMHTLDDTLAGARQRSQIKNNYAATIGHFRPYLAKTHMPREQQRLVAEERISGYLRSAAARVNLPAGLRQCAVDAFEATCEQVGGLDALECPIAQVQDMFVENLRRAVARARATGRMRAEMAARAGHAQKFPGTAQFEIPDAITRKNEDPDLPSYPPKGSGLLARATALLDMENRAARGEAAVPAHAISAAPKPMANTQGLKKALERRLKNHPERKLSRAARIAMAHAGARRG